MPLLLVLRKTNKAKTHSPLAGEWMGRRALFAGCVTGAVLAAGLPAVAAERAFNIPAQPLANALAKFGVQSGRTILFDPMTVEGRTAPPVVGRFEPAQALARLISGAPLRIQTTASGFIVSAGVASTSFAAPAPPADPPPVPPPAPEIVSGPSELDQIVITGSRAAVAGFRSPTPTTVLSAEAIATQGATTVAAALTQIPAFKASQSPGSNGPRGANPGSSVAELRGLGGQRTLLLIDGKRVVPQAPAINNASTVSPDMNQVPTLLVDRVEVVTGGAAAQWGSDAVAGVVNILLKTRFTGLEARLQGGIAQRGDAGSQSAGVLYGTAFAGGQGHLVLAAEYFNNEGLGDLYVRPWSSRDFNTVTNPSPAANGQPQLVVSGDVRAALASGGRISGPANFSYLNQQFAPGGALTPFAVGALAGATTMIGGSGLSPAQAVTQIPATRRFNPYLHAEYDFTDRLTGFAELSYAMSRAAFSGSGARTTFTIRQDNPYLPAAVAAAMATQNVQSLSLGRVSYDLGGGRPVVKNTTPYGALGLRGQLGGDWRWDAHYAFGVNTSDNVTYNDVITQRLLFAADAVRDASGQVVCRATQAGAAFNPNALGCKPLNLFGNGAVASTPEGIDYVVGVGHAKAVYSQHSAGANVRGAAFRTGAGDVAVAAGAEYRREHEKGTVDPIGQVGGYNGLGNTTALEGGFEVVEGYVETVVPLLKDAELAKSLDLNGAVRIAHYSTAGSQTTWKAGGVYEPVAGLRLRMTRSRDIRAPAIPELFGGGAVVTGGAVSVHGYSLVIPTNVTLGNPNLKPEKADTFTAGAVLELRGALRDFRASVDYYDIDIKDAITQLNAANIGSLCDLGQQAYCGLFTFAPSGAPLALNAGVANAASLHSQGVDFVAAYQTPLDAVVAGTPGRLELGLNGTYTRHSTVNLGGGTRSIDRAGENGQANLGAIPRSRATFSATYAYGRLSATAQVNFVSSGRIDNTYNTQGGQTINRNRVPARAYTALFSRYEIGRARRFTLFAGVDNLFDQAPPVDPYALLNLSTNGQYYDRVGRYFRLGLSARFP